MHSFQEFYNVYKSSAGNTGESYNDFTRTVASLQQTNDNIAPKKNSECLIVIPAYTNRISEFEQINLKNNVEKLGKYFDICIVCPKLLRADVYNSIASGVELQYLRLPSRNFIGKNSYSNMLLSADFYKHFIAWKYILILQLDAYIFGTADDLKNFVAMDKTYIGAPWTKEYASSIGIPEEACGNGGLSLRKVLRMIDILKPGSDLKRNERLKTVEDLYISYILYNVHETTDIKTAVEFAIDNNPELWHKRLGRYPWGIHMGKQEFVDYWNKVTDLKFSQRNPINPARRTGVLSLMKRKVEVTERIIVSLTSFRERLKNDAPNVIREILTQQTIKPELVVLSIYKDDEQYVPDSILKLQKEGKVEIIVYDKNYRPHLKYYPAMMKYKDAVIITVDDDQHYYSKMIEDLYRTHIEYPNTVCACRCHCITYKEDGITPKNYGDWIFLSKEKSVPSFDLFATGVGGVLYPANILHVEDIKEEDIYDYITTDDILLKIIENERNVRVVGTPDYRSMRPYTTKSAKSERLCDVNTTGNKINDINIQKGRLMKREETAVKICYTCITGKYDALIEPLVVTPGWKYICFTDLTNFTSKVWEIRPLPESIANDESLSIIKKQRIIKIKPYEFLENYDICLWVDGNLTIKCNLDEFVDKIADDDVVITKHPKRDCIYDEAEAIVKYRKDTWNNLNPQLDFYRQENFPHHYGLHETNVIVRKNTDKVKKVMDMWAEVLRKYSHRDLMALSYVLWKLGIKISSFEPLFRDLRFQYNNHKRR